MDPSRRQLYPGLDNGLGYARGHRVSFGNSLACGLAGIVWGGIIVGAGGGFQRIPARSTGVPPVSSMGVSPMSVCSAYFTAKMAVLREGPSVAKRDWT